MEKNIDYQDYQDNYKRYFCSLNCEQMIDIIDYLKGKSTSGEFEEIDDCAVELLSRFLTMDWGRTIIIEYTKEQKKFIKSDYLSNFFKKSIKEMLGDRIAEEVNKVLNNDKNINDMTEESKKRKAYLSKSTKEKRNIIKNVKKKVIKITFFFIHN